MRVPVQLAIILSISLAGDMLHHLAGIPIPGNILGMLLLFTLLCLHIVKLEHIEKCTSFFLKYLAFFFVPAGVAIIAIAKSLQSQILAILLICIGTTISTIVITGHSVQLINKKTERKTNKAEDGKN